MVQVHGTCVALCGSAVMSRGASGSGKSDLALRLIDGGARLVADDRAEVVERDGRLFVSAPAEIAGLIEVRGLGVLRLNDDALEAPLGLVVDLVPPETVTRLPEAQVCSDFAVPVPLIEITPFEASAPAKVRLALRRACGSIMSSP